MAYYPEEISIADALNRIHRHEYVLPAIQREFVWRPRQICLLFDSLMRGYPMGAFLFWSVAKERAGEFKFYDFVRSYHEKDRPHCPPLTVPPGSPATAVLDGQQRLTALNIGLAGGMAVKEPRRRWDNPAAFPERRLRLNLLAAPGDDDGSGMLHKFNFLTDEEAAEREENVYWFTVADVRSMKDLMEAYDHLSDHGITHGQRQAFKTLGRLHAVVHDAKPISGFVEKEQDLDRVLNIFIRTNSGGTVLSYSDLLLSIATAQWTGRSARDDIRRLVDDMNAVGDGFTLTKDFVLKAGLMLCDVPQVGFKVNNFNRDNMARLEAGWPAIADALMLTVRLAASFGFSERTLGADSPLLVLAYYLHKRGLGTSYLSAGAETADRERVRRWLIRSGLKPASWSGGLDTFLTNVRAALCENGGQRFPVEEIEKVMRNRARGLRFEPEEIEDLADARFGDKRVFGLLSLLYPGIDLGNVVHVDHVFPRALFTPTRLRKHGVPEGDVDAYLDRVDRLANLHLLQGTFNAAKGARLPRAWLTEALPSPEAAAAYAARHDLDGLPDDLAGFGVFYEERRRRVVEKLTTVLRETAADENA